MYIYVYIYIYTYIDQSKNITICKAARYVQSKVQM